MITILIPWFKLSLTSKSPASTLALTDSFKEPVHMCVHTHTSPSTLQLHWDLSCHLGHMCASMTHAHQARESGTRGVKRMALVSPGLLLCVHAEGRLATSPTPVPSSLGSLHTRPALSSTHGSWGGGVTREADEHQHSLLLSNGFPNWSDH